MTINCYAFCTVRMQDRKLVGWLKTTNTLKLILFFIHYAKSYIWYYPIKDLENIFFPAHAFLISSHDSR